MNYLAWFCNDKEVVLQCVKSLPSLRWCDDAVAPHSIKRPDVDFIMRLSRMVLNRL